MLILKLFTSESADEIRAKGGSYSWKLNTAKANLCSYAVLYHNARSRVGPKALEHREGFLIGRIASFKPVEGRHAVIFDGIAKLPVPDEWPVGHQNPVNYAEVDGSQFSDIEFEPLKPVTPAAPPNAEPARAGLSIAQAKAGLAAFYGVAPDAIEITIRG
jgi:hypothetical protein